MNARRCFDPACSVRTKKEIGKASIGAENARSFSRSLLTPIPGARSALPSFIISMISAQAVLEDIVHLDAGAAGNGVHHLNGET